MQSLLAGTAVPGTDPGMTCEWWWVEPGEEGLEYIGRVVLQPEPGPREGHLHVAVRPSRRRQGHGTRLLEAALPIAAGRGFPSVVLACPRHNEPARRLVLGLGATPLSRGSAVDRFNLSAQAVVR
ncbi:GNAT family N-acetyltransferase [Actinocorallia libanotica]|uniref:GNAT family N-acetyltransferase n=1 Tax=Actinocorallia libanotica TaxID=46162 RepID=UPI0031CF39B3